MKVYRKVLPWGKRATDIKLASRRIDGARAGTAIYIGGRRFVIPVDCYRLTVNYYTWYTLEYCVPCWETRRVYGSKFTWSCTSNTGEHQRSKPTPDFEQTAPSPIEDSGGGIDLDLPDGDSSYPVYVSPGNRVDPEPQTVEYDRILVYNPSITPGMSLSDRTGYNPANKPYQNDLIFENQFDFMDWLASTDEVRDVNTVPTGQGFPSQYQSAAGKDSGTQYHRDTDGDYYDVYMPVYDESEDKETAQQDAYDRHDLLK